MTDAFVGIDVAFAKRKRLPPCFFHSSGRRVAKSSTCRRGNAPRPGGEDNRPVIGNPESALEV